MWLLRYLQLNESGLSQHMKITMLWRYSWQMLLASYLGVFCLLVFLVLSTAFGFLTWQERQYMREEEQLEEQLRQMSTEIRSLTGQGSWQGITVMPALAATLPVPGLRTQLSDLEFLHQLARRFQVGKFVIHPLGNDNAKELSVGLDRSQETGLWRNYEMRFRARAENWLAIISHLTLLPGVRLQTQAWSDEGDAVLRLEVAGQLPASIVGQVGSREGASRLVLQNGRLQRAFKNTEGPEANVP